MKKLLTSILALGAVTLSANPAMADLSQTYQQQNIAQNELNEAHKMCVENTQEKRTVWFSKTNREYVVVYGTGVYSVGSLKSGIVCDKIKKNGDIGQQMTRPLLNGATSTTLWTKENHSLVLYHQTYIPLLGNTSVDRYQYN